VSAGVPLPSRAPASEGSFAAPEASPLPVVVASPEVSPVLPMVVADLEGTCTAGETWRGVGAWLSANGRRGRYRRFLAPRLAALPLVRLGLVSRQAFRDRWIADLARLLDGLDGDELARVAEEVVERHLWPARRDSVIAELEAAAAAGARVAIATGTYQPVLDAFIARLATGPAGPVAGLGTALEIADGLTTGRLVGRIGTGRRKARRVRAWAGEAVPAPSGVAVPGRDADLPGREPSLAAAYGDSLADAPLLEMAVEPVAVAPDPELRALAVARGWRILDDVAAEA
jgi:phosphoserine phosphatase